MNIKIENARIIFRNFSGRPDKFNTAGDRTFCVLLDDSTAKSMADEGWNIKWLPARNIDETDTPYLQVKVKYGDFPPKIYKLVPGGTPVLLNELTVNDLDTDEIVNADIILSPYHYEFAGRQGISAYIKTGYFTIEDDFGGKYSSNEAI